jgi:hypothetical protein
MVFVSLPNLFSYIGVSLTFCTALAVGSLLILRQRAGWKKLRIISFAYPAVPVGCLCIAGAMTLYSVMLKLAPSLSAAATILGGCWLCHKLIRRDDSPGMGAAEVASRPQELDPNVRQPSSAARSS